MQRTCLTLSACSSIFCMSKPCALHLAAISAGERVFCLPSAVSRRCASSMRPSAAGEPVLSMSTEGQSCQAVQAYAGLWAGVTLSLAAATSCQAASGPAVGALAAVVVAAPMKCCCSVATHAQAQCFHYARTVVPCTGIEGCRIIACWRNLLWGYRYKRCRDWALLSQQHQGPCKPLCCIDLKTCSPVWGPGPCREGTPTTK